MIFSFVGNGDLVVAPGQYSARTMQGQHVFTAQWFAFDLAMHAMSQEGSQKEWDRPVLVKLDGEEAVGSEPDWQGIPIVVELPAVIKVLPMIRARKWACAIFFNQLGFD